jgi:glycosyltransferase involved in cell wall biosynthesis
MKIILIGHACGPLTGSEPAITWNWAVHLARDNEVTVMANPTERSAIEAHLRSSPIPGLKFHWVTVPPWMDPWRPGRKHFIRIHYLLWQRFAMRAVRRATSNERYDYVHYISWNTVSAAPDFRDINAPAVWGPIGGGQVPPLRFIRYFGVRAIPELVRMARVRLLPLKPRLRKAAHATKPTLVINNETAELLQAVGARSTRPFLEVGISDDAVAVQARRRSAAEPLVVLWAGRLEPHKALPLALEALARTDRNIRLEVAGDGYMRRAWERRARKLGLGGRVKFLGQVPLHEMRETYNRADAFLFTSLRDSSGGVVFEAMAAGLPVIVPDHQGCAAHVPPEGGIKFPVGRPHETIRDITVALERFHDDEGLRHRSASGALAYARELTWTAKIARFTELLAEEGIA